MERQLPPGQGNRVYFMLALAHHPMARSPRISKGGSCPCSRRKNNMDEQKLIEKLRLIETLYAGAATAGERVAAGNARERIRERLHRLQGEDKPIEFRFSLADVWSRKLFVALLRRYDLKPYRYRGQRRTTVMVRVPKNFVNETLWPEYQELSRSLHSYLDEVTERVIREEIHGDASEAEESRSTTAARSAMRITWLKRGGASTMPWASRIRSVRWLSAASTDSGAELTENSPRRWCSTKNT